MYTRIFLLIYTHICVCLYVCERERETRIEDIIRCTRTHTHTHVVRESARTRENSEIENGDVLELSKIDRQRHNAIDTDTIIEHSRIIAHKLSILPSAVAALSPPFPPKTYLLNDEFIVLGCLH